MRIFELKTLSKLQKVALGEILGTIPSDAYFGLRDSSLFNYILAAKDKEFVEKISSDFAILGVKTNIHRRKAGLWYIEVCRKSFSDFLPYFRRENKKWVFSDRIMNCPLKYFKIAVMRSFADAEGSVTCKIDNKKFFSRRVVIYNNSKVVLSQLGQILDSLDINYYIRLDRLSRTAFIRGQKCNFSSAYSLRITNYRNLKLFYQLIGFNISRKQDLLKRMLDSYKNIVREYLPQDYYRVLALHKRLQNCREVSRCLKISPQTVQNWALAGIRPRSLKTLEYNK